VRKIIFFTMISLDGYIEKPGDAPDWVSVDEELMRHITNLKRQVGGFLWGRGMYENNYALWSSLDTQSMPAGTVEYWQIWKQIPAIVFSSTLQQVEGNTRLERGNPIAVVTRLKEQPAAPGEPDGDLEVGGWQLANTLMHAGLVDEYRLFVQPILLGNGRPIFPALNEAVRLKLVETHTFQTGVVYLRYQR